jgi:hypothetical protein
MQASNALVLACKWSPPTTAHSASKSQKEMGKDDFTKIPNGGPGVEHGKSLIYSGGGCSANWIFPSRP